MVKVYWSLYLNPFVTLKERTLEGLSTSDFDIRMCFSSQEPPIYTSFGMSLQAVGNAWRERISANGNRPLAEANLLEAVGHLKVEARNQGLVLEKGTVGIIRALIWADLLFTHLREDYEHLSEIQGVLQRSR